jgi:hypothetical protein
MTGFRLLQIAPFLRASFHRSDCCWFALGVHNISWSRGHNLDRGRTRYDNFPSQSNGRNVTPKALPSPALTARHGQQRGIKLPEREAVRPCEDLSTSEHRIETRCDLYLALGKCQRKGFTHEVGETPGAARVIGTRIAGSFHQSCARVDARKSTSPFPLSPRIEPAGQISFWDLGAMAASSHVL